MSAEFKINLAPVSDENAIETVHEIFDGTKSKLGFVPNMYRTMGNFSGYLSTYFHGYNAFRQAWGFTPQEHERVFLTLSREHGCDYCTAAHSMVAAKNSKFSAKDLAPIRVGTALPNAKLNALSLFTSHVH